MPLMLLTHFFKGDMSWNRTFIEKYNFRAHHYFLIVGILLGIADVIFCAFGAKVLIIYDASRKKVRIT
jgi:hypothetical protein